MCGPRNILQSVSIPSNINLIQYDIPEIWYKKFLCFIIDKFRINVADCAGIVTYCNMNTKTQPCLALLRVGPSNVDAKDFDIRRVRPFSSLPHQPNKYGRCSRVRWKRTSEMGGLVNLHPLFTLTVFSEALVQIAEFTEASTSLGRALSLKPQTH